MNAANLSRRSSNRFALIAFALTLVIALVVIAQPAESAPNGKFEASAQALDSDPALRAEQLTPGGDANPGPDPLLRRKGGGKQLDLGFADFLYNEQKDSVKQLKLTKTTNADVIRVNMYWSLVAPQPPADPRNPDDPAYNWTQYDRAIVNATKLGFDIDLTVLAAPGWAEGPNRPDSIVEAPPGSWRPDAGAFGNFAHALAVRYSGSFVPGSGSAASGGSPPPATSPPPPSGPLPPLPLPRADGTLPFVKYMEAWNEPNLSTYITPQWEGKKNVASDIYAKLLNNFYDEVKAVNPAIEVVSGGTAPYGDPPGGPNRTRPERFLQELLCLTPKNKKGKCPNGVPSKFDIIAHHPINREDPPTEHADADGDIEVADFGELTKVLRKAEKAGTTGTPGKHDIWANEVWWQTDPPDTVEGIPIKTHARWLAQSMYLLWKQGASNVSFLQFRDAKYTKGEFTLASYQTGVYTFDNKRKLSADAVAFPFVVDQQGSKYIGWGVAPKGGKVTIEAKQKGVKGGYKTVGTANAKEGKVFQTNVRIKGKAKLRAKVGGKTSIVWDQKS